MKRLIIPAVILVAVLALYQWGNRILESTLDAQLPGLLTSELSIQVTFEPVRTWIPKLAVHTPKLVMGDPANPALVATGVNISLDWSDLLRGEIRLRRATGATLLVNPSLWPGNDDPWPTDYSFIEPYLPDYLALDSVRYVTAEGRSHTFIKPQWQRQYPVVNLQWQGAWNGQAIGLTGVLHSLPDLLQLASLQLEVTATATGKEDAEITAELDLRPGSSSGYTLTTTVTTEGMKAQLKSGSGSAWVLPTQSGTSINSLDLKKLITLFDKFNGDDPEQGPDAWLKTNVPGLDWPQHKGQVSITEVRWQDEVALDNSLDFTTGPEGLGITSLTSTGPGGVLKAKGDVASSSAGWKVSASADITAAKEGQGLAAAYLESDWLWREGRSTIQGGGKTWGALLNSLTGDIALDLSHRGTADTPVSVTAKLDNRPGEFALDMIDIKLAQGHITGSVVFSGEKQKHLSGKINANQINVGFLIPDADPNAPAGLPVPEFLNALPGVELDLQLDISALTAKRIHINQASVVLARTAEQGSLSLRAKNAGGGALDLDLSARMFPDKPSTVALDAEFSRFDFARVFQQASGAIDYRTSGTIKFSSQGKGLNQVFRAMQGTANLTVDLRRDHDWQRAANPREQLRLSGDAALVMTQERITGLQITRLVVDNAQQNLTGSVSMVDGRKPWLEADLVSSRLDLPRLRELQPQETPEEPGMDPVQSLKDLGDARLSLKVESLTLENATLTKAVAQVSTAPDSVTIDQLDFFLDQGRLTSRGAITWKKEAAAFSLDANVTDLAIDQFLTGAASKESVVPLSGSITLSSSGTTLDSLLANLSGDISLSTGQGAANAANNTAASGGQIEMTASRTADGMRAEIRRFQWLGSDLSGSVQYHQATPPLVAVEIAGGALSLLAFEEDPQAVKAVGKKTDESIVSSTAKASAGLLGDVVAAPVRALFGAREAKPGDKIFSSTPLPFDWMKDNSVTLKGKLDTITGRKVSATDVQFSGRLTDGTLVAEASAGTMNRGSASARLSLNVAETPAKLDLHGTFRDFRGQMIKADIPRSGSFNLSSQGQSEAELAANTNGVMYLELGAGPIDYRNTTLLTADVATNTFRTLIPGVEKKPPTLDCAVTLAVFKNGIGTTPFGYAARTREANLVGQVDINLKKELMHMSFISSNRKGVGISVSSVFSNTVEIQGPLTDPKIVPNTSGLLWRGWAAVMTAGLSVVGESVLKRALASEDPCKSVQKHIHKKFCGTPEAAGASTMICPATGSAAPAVRQ